MSYSEKTTDKKEKAEILVSPLTSHLSEFDTGEHEVFLITEDGPDFRGVGTIGGAVLIAKSQIGLGVLGIPQTFQALGLVPGLICLITLCAISTWTGLVVGKFRLRYRHVYSVGDATEMMFGKVGREFIGGAFWLFYVLCYGASLLTVSIALNTLSEHAICTNAWVGIGAFVSLLLATFVRTMKVMSWCSYIALTSVFVSVWVVAFACIAQKTPAMAPKGVPVDRGIIAVSTGVPFSTIASAVGTQLLGLCGTASFFTIHSEMRDPTQYRKSLLLGQGFVAFNYIAAGCIIYGRVGVYVTSPALGSAGMLFQKICYGIALPALLYSCFFQSHLAAKYTLVRILRGTRHLQANSVIHWVTWVLAAIASIIGGYVIASGIPFFNDLLALIGALLGTCFTLIIPGFIVLFAIAKVVPSQDEGRLIWLRECQRQWRKDTVTTIKTIVAVFCIVFGVYILISGVYGSVQSIINSYKEGSVSGAFSCEDNS